MSSSRFSKRTKVLLWSDPSTETCPPLPVLHLPEDNVIDAVCKSKTLKIAFPKEHQEQLKIAKEFEDLTSAQFRNCVGAIDAVDY